jgi:hypothetical protein
MSKKSRGTTGDANKRREHRFNRLRRCDVAAASMGLRRQSAVSASSNLPLTLHAIRAICKAAGAVDVRIREWLGGAVVIPLGKRGRPAHPLIVQRVRAECLSRKPAGVELHVLWRDDGLSGRALAVRHARVYSDGTVVLPDCAVMTRLP